MTTLDATPQYRLRLRLRTSLLLLSCSALGIAAFLWPLLAHTSGDENRAHAGDAPWVLLVLLPMLVAVVASELRDGALDAKALAVLGVLSACGAVMRLPGGGPLGGSAVFFLLIPAGRVLGRGFGFVLGATTMFASALVTGGVGPWLPFQMFAAAWFGFGAGCLPRARGRAELVLLAGYGAIASLGYGLVMDMWFWPFTAARTQFAYVVGASVADNLQRFWAYHLTSALGYDFPRAVVSAGLVLLAGRPVLVALRRAARRASFGVAGSFADATAAGDVR